MRCDGELHIRQNIRHFPAAEVGFWFDLHRSIEALSGETDFLVSSAERPAHLARQQYGFAHSDHHLRIQLHDDTPFNYFILVNNLSLAISS